MVYIMLQRIRRNDLVDVVKWYKSNTGPRLQVPDGAHVVGRTHCVNVDGVPITPGLRVAPKSFFPASISFENALKALYNNALKIAVGRAATDDPNYGTALQPSRVANGIFSAVFEGLFTSIVTGSGAYLLSSGSLTSDSANAIGSVIATSAPSEDGRKLALVKPLSSSSGGLTRSDFETKLAKVVTDISIVDSKIKITWDNLLYLKFK